MKRIALLMLMNLFTLHSLMAQAWREQPPGDLFQEARAQAFNKKYDEAIEKLSFILGNYPDDTDVRLFLARVLAWKGDFDSAEQQAAQVIASAPMNLEALEVLTDIGLWSGDTEDAQRAIDRALLLSPADFQLLYKKAAVEHALGNDRQTMAFLAKALSINPSHNESLALLKDLKTANLRYTGTASYGIEHYERRFDPAHVGSFQLARLNAWGQAIGRINYANRFNQSGWQGEVDLYPSIKKGMYAYLNYGYSSSILFPRHRAGAEWFFSFARRMEGSLGARYLAFRENNVVLYTGAIGIYPKNYWLSVRPFVIIDSRAGTSWSAMATVRRYFSTAEAHLTLTAGYGFAPDAQRIQSIDGISTESIDQLESLRAGLALQQPLRLHFMLLVSVEMNEQEFFFASREKIFIGTASVGLRKRF